MLLINLLSIDSTTTVIGRQYCRGTSAYFRGKPSDCIWKGGPLWKTIGAAGWKNAS